jgi:membrane associated rhomboid family serine protease
MIEKWGLTTLSPTSRPSNRRQHHAVDRAVCPHFSHRPRCYPDKRVAYSSRSYARPYLGVPGLPRGIKWLLIANVGLFLLRWILGSSVARIFSILSLVPEQFTHGYLWQPLTYSFIHGRGDLWEILWNMLTLWMFGGDIELSWGTDRFLRFYFLCAAGPALVIVALAYLTGNPLISVIGAYAPIYGILLVCAVLWPDRQVLFIIFPMKMKYFTILIGAIALFISLSSGGLIGLGLLTGMAFGYLFMKSSATSTRRTRIDLTGSVQRAYKDWKLARAKKKFQVYLNKQRSNRDIN